MSLIVTAGKTAKLTILGTSATLPSVFVRLGVFMPINKKAIRIESACFQSREDFEKTQWAISITEIPHGTKDYTMPEGDQLLAAHNIIKEQLEDAGYDVEIIDL